MSSTTELISAFSSAMNDRDLDAAISFMTNDCIFEDTEPAPDGTRYVGRDAIRQAWVPMFANEATRFESEEIIEMGDRVVQLSRYSWGDGHVRGVNVMRIRDGKIAELLCYVKG